ncbi:MAG: hypothetical protein A2096_10115 [Spirochaetes bacterium GWF1_41_5]|nr:MAG: hypothetical protein A2096_10115 [Spirochaetes bacterium GWF1_41_5]HBE02527.1 hypothetical protein [Spirochaetia bacterium]
MTLSKERVDFFAIRGKVDTSHIVWVAHNLTGKNTPKNTTCNIALQVRKPEFFKTMDNAKFIMNTLTS